MSIPRLISITVILIGATAAWVILGTALKKRSGESFRNLRSTVAGNSGPPLTQSHPTAYYLSPTTGDTKRPVQPTASKIDITLRSNPKEKGLVRYRTYDADFSGEYQITNPTPITQTFYLGFQLPGETRFDKFSLQIGDKVSTKAPLDGTITEALRLGPGESTPVRVAYRATGLDTWSYRFANTPRIRDFHLTMKTDFQEIDIPAGSESPTSRQASADGLALSWDYVDVIGANAVAMEMPRILNPGPVASRITFFAPVSLLFFFTVLIITAMVRGVDLHPVNYFFLAAGCFAFQLLFAYLVDLINIHIAFAISAAVSLVLVSGYLWRATGSGFARTAAVAQFAYMILFSYSFFFNGLTGITITVGAIITLALLMARTARTNWTEVLQKKPTPPVPPTMPIPQSSP